MQLTVFTLQWKFYREIRIYMKIHIQSTIDIRHWFWLWLWQYQQIHNFWCLFSWILESQRLLSFSPLMQQMISCRWKLSHSRYYRISQISFVITCNRWFRFIFVLFITKTTWIFCVFWVFLMFAMNIKKSKSNLSKFRY